MHMATMSSRIFSPVEAPTPALPSRARPARTISAMPEASKPTQVTQLSSDRPRPPLRP